MGPVPQDTSATGPARGGSGDSGAQGGLCGTRTPGRMDGWTDGHEDPAPGMRQELETEPQGRGLLSGEDRPDFQPWELQT